MNSNKKILVLGAAGQIGVELVLALRQKYGAENVIASDVQAEPIALQDTGPWRIIDVMHGGNIQSVIIRHQITDVYLLAAMLSATGEAKPLAAWQLNMQSLLNMLEIAREEKVRLFWPSSIAAINPTSTVYGNSKYAGECWCQYYHERYGVDVRSIRYPGLVSWKSEPGGGTTDWAVDIFHAALAKKKYECFLGADTRLPMLYMPDAIAATLQLMEAPAENIRNRMGYELKSLCFTPDELYQTIKSLRVGFQIAYEPDHRQKIADSWPKECDGEQASNDFGFAPQWSLALMANDMLENLEKYKREKISRGLHAMGVL